MCRREWERERESECVCVVGGRENERESVCDAKDTQVG